MSAPALSVVVPSYQRRASLERVLEGLAAQRGFAPEVVETIVVLDGGSDDSPAMLDAWVRAARLPGLRWRRRENAGQAAARHAGVLEARAPVVLFLDDDVVPGPGLLARHLAHHARGERIAVLGECEIVRGDAPHPFYLQHVWSWWEDKYAARARPGRLACHQDFCAGNVSLRRDDYLASGGFDAAFRGYGGEDYDLGYRLLRDGVRFVADRGAHAWHHHHLDGGYEKLLLQRRQEGRAEVVLGRKHPELRAGLRLMRHEVGWRMHDRLARLALTPAGMPPWLLRLRTARLAWYERRGWRAPWFRELSLLGAYAFWRGVHEALGTRQALEAFRAEATVRTQEVDVTHGLPDAPPGFWVEAPSEVRLSAGGETLGTVRLPGPVTLPWREAMAEAIAKRGAPALPALLAWSARTGAGPLSRG